MDDQIEKKKGTQKKSVLDIDKIIKERQKWLRLRANERGLSESWSEHRTIFGQKVNSKDGDDERENERMKVK